MTKPQQQPLDSRVRIRRPYVKPRLIEYGSVAKLTQGSRSVQQDFSGATTFKMKSCL
jgi:hypothetical protein